MSATSATTPWRSSFAFFYAGQFTAITGLEFATYCIWGYVAWLYGFPLWVKVSVFLWYLPFLIAAPFAGSLVDRWGARRSMVVASIAGGLNFMAIALLTVVGASRAAPILFVLPLYFAVILKALHLTAFDASIPFLVPKRSLNKANGMRIVVTGAAAILGAALSGPLIGALGLYGVIAMGCLCYAFALLTLRNLSIARPPRTAADTAPGSLLKSLLTEFGWAWRYVTDRPGLAPLLVVVALAHVGLSSSEALWNLMALPFASRDEIILCAVSAAAGITVGTVLTVVLGSVRRLADTILVSSMLLAGAMVLGSLRPSVALLAISAFLLLASTPILVGSIQTLMQLKVVPGMLGRTAAMRNLFVVVGFMGTRIVTLLVIVRLIGKDVHAPWLAPVVGAGPGRGYAAATLVIGIVLAVCFLFVYLRSALRDVEQNFPDVTPHDAAGQPVSVAAEVGEAEYR